MRIETRRTVREDYLNLSFADRQARVGLLTQRRVEDIAVAITVGSVRDRRERRRHDDSEDDHREKCRNLPRHGGDPVTPGAPFRAPSATADAGSLPTGYFGINGQFESPASMLPGRL